MEKKSDKKLILAGFGLILFGITGFLVPFYEYLLPEDAPVYEAAAQLPTFEEELIIPSPSIAPVVSSTPSVIQDRLLIADVKINMPVFVGDDEKILNKGAWLYPITSRPELGSNTVIFGHRYLYRPPKSNTLWNLDKVEYGDEIVLHWKGIKYVYKVFEIKVIEPTDLSVIQPTNDSRLTVITCTPLFSTKQRLVVVGNLVTQ